MTTDTSDEASEDPGMDDAETACDECGRWRPATARLVLDKRGGLPSCPSCARPRMGMTSAPMKRPTKDAAAIVDIVRAALIQRVSAAEAAQLILKANQRRMRDLRRFGRGKRIESQLAIVRMINGLKTRNRRIRRLVKQYASLRAPAENTGASADRACLVIRQSIVANYVTTSDGQGTWT